MFCAVLSKVFLECDEFVRECQILCNVMASAPYLTMKQEMELCLSNAWQCVMKLHLFQARNLPTAQNHLRTNIKIINVNKNIKTLRDHIRCM